MAIITSHGQALAHLTKEAKNTFDSLTNEFGKIRLYELPGDTAIQVFRGHQYIGRLHPDGMFVAKGTGSKGGRKPRATDQDLIKAHRDGLSYYEAAALFGISHEQIAYRWRRLSLSPNKVKSPLPDEAFIDAHRSGLNSTEASKALSRHQSAVLRRWKKLGLLTEQKRHTVWRPLEQVEKELGLEPETRKEMLDRLRAERRIGSIG